MPEKTVAKLQQLFEENRNESNQLTMEAYMRHQFSFYGIKAKERRELSKAWLNELVFEEKKTKIILNILWELEERECQYVALDYLIKQKKKLQKQDVTLLEWLIRTKPWWDTVDLIASHLVGSLFRRHPDLIDSVGESWLNSNHMWLQRTMLIYQLKYKEATDEVRLFKNIIYLKEIDEFFIQKAIGWALREYSKSKPEAVANFIETHSLSKLAVREGSKYL